MSKELEKIGNIEYLIHELYSDKQPLTEAQKERKKEAIDDCKDIYKALAELKAIKEAKPSKALECLKSLDIQVRFMGILDIPSWEKSLPTIKQALLKAEKLEKVWEIVKEKNVNIGHFYFVVFVLKKDYESCKLNNNNVMYNICDTEKDFLTQQEFELLKEVLE